MQLYHGTTKENAESIKNDGIINGPVYFTNRYEVAEEYALNNCSNAVIIEIDFEGELKPDNERENYENSEEALENEGSVFTENSVSIQDCKFHKYEDFEKVV